jgi:hypothetical protein
MGKTTHRLGSIATALAVASLLLAAALGLGCAGRFAGPLQYQYFTAPEPNDAWSRKIRLWQARERVDQDDSELAPVAGEGVAAEPADRAEPLAVESVETEMARLPEGATLRAKYEAFRGERKRAIARELAGWIQGQAREHYVPDGPIDHWATLEETFIRNGDDCDGLELLTYNLLRDLGFGADEVFRAIVFRRSDGQHHMVTLWFEDANDPWVIDPTGAMTSGMPRMSGVPGWTPLKIFSEDADYTVQPGSAAERLARN